MKKLLAILLLCAGVTGFGQAEQSSGANLYSEVEQAKAAPSLQNDDLIVIPVVFHIIHANGPENISALQVLSAIEHLNSHMRGQDAQIEDVLPEFQDLIADTKIEFRLASRDPSGNCHSGINRIESDLTFVGDDAMKALIQWPRNMYLNVWVCANASGAEGYALYPANVNGSWGLDLDGIVIQHTYCGAVGTSDELNSRMLTNYVGKWLNLRPTWGNSNLPGLEENCEMDDNVEDTPNTIGWSSCDLSGSTCGSLDNVQNYMSYSFCSRMFTYGQKQRMRAAALSTTAQRNQLSALSNLQATGVDIVGPENECFCPGIIDECGICNGPGASGECGCFAVPEGDCDCEGNQFDAIGVCGGTCTLDNDGNGVCDENELYGCTYPLALNYSILATRDDGSCDFNICGFGTVFDATTGNCIIDENYCSWQPDSDGDQLIGVSDLLMFLSVFGDTDLDQDGIFDSNDDCVGEYDECGVCNGSGPSIPIVESIEILYDSVYAEQIDEWFVFEIGVDTTYQYVCETIEGCTDSTAYNYDEFANLENGSCTDQWECGLPIQYDQYWYETVLIAGRCWFSENCKHLLEVTPSEIGSEDSEGPYAYVTGYEGSNVTDAKSTLEFETFGVLYNFRAATEWEICPSGWHVPSREEVYEMFASLEIDNTLYGGLKSTGDLESGSGLWRFPNAGATNSTGFSAQPAGIRIPSGFSDLYEFAHFRTQTEADTNLGFTDGYVFQMPYSNSNVSMVQYPKDYAMSARCIKDTE